MKWRQFPNVKRRGFIYIWIHSSYFILNSSIRTSLIEKFISDVFNQNFPEARHFLFFLPFFFVPICFLWHLVNLFPNRFDRWKVQKCKANETCAIYFQPMNILSRLRVCRRQIEFDWLIDTPLHTRSEISFSKNTKIASTLVRGKKMSASKKWQKKNLNNFGGDSHERSSIWGQKNQTHIYFSIDFAIFQHEQNAPSNDRREQINERTFNLLE